MKAYDQGKLALQVKQTEFTTILGGNAEAKQGSPFSNLEEFNAL
ncbi:hypothetical protein [Photobacterium lutimaris]|nr:hypothetical protein [Photobacterium lutimaris]